MTPEIAIRSRSAAVRGRYIELTERVAHPQASENELVMLEKSAAWLALFHISAVTPIAVEAVKQEYNEALNHHFRSKAHVFPISRSWPITIGLLREMHRRLFDDHALGRIAVRLWRPAGTQVAASTPG